ncbi:MAG: Clp protease N-terminal domain-containing protein, partial [Candidatus Acidiferrales bacterium]
MSEVSAEHILLGVLREDPQLFVLLAPANANLVGEIEESLATNAKASVTETRKQVLRLSKNAKEIIRVAARERVRLGHKSVGTQHLLLALLRCPEERTSWFRRLRRQ